MKDEGKNSSTVRPGVDTSVQPTHQHFTRRSKIAGKMTGKLPSDRMTEQIRAEGKVHCHPIAKTPGSNTKESKKRKRKNQSLSPISSEDQVDPLASPLECHLDPEASVSGLTFLDDGASVTIHDFADRMYDIVYTVCVSNRAKENNVKDKDTSLFQDEEIYMSLPDLVDRLVKWPGSSRSVSVVALIIMDRLQTSLEGVVVNFDSVSKIFTMCMLLSRKVMEDKAVWNVDIADFGVFPGGSKEVHNLEKVCLRILDWKLGVSEEEFKLYDNAILKPIMAKNDEEMKPFKKRKSITMISSDSWDRNACCSSQEASITTVEMKTQVVANPPSFLETNSTSNRVSLA